MQFTTNNDVNFKQAAQPHFVFLKMPVQEHEGEIVEEGTRLDFGEEGEEEKTGTVCTRLCFKLLILC